jgi:hypothetical protein
VRLPGAIAALLSGERQKSGVDAGLKGLIASPESSRAPMSERNHHHTRGRNFHGLALAFLVGWASIGCGNTLYVFRVNAASNKLEEAKELGAEKLAPYEYYTAVEHLNKARMEAAEADYSDAIEFAEIAEEHAEKAIRLARDSHRGAGR